MRLLREVRRELNALKVPQRYMVRGLEHEFLFDPEYVEDVACTDDVDRAILEELHYAGTVWHVAKRCIQPIKRVQAQAVECNSTHTAHEQKARPHACMQQLVFAWIPWQVL